MKKNHLFSIITAGMLTITLLAGCGNTGSNANGNTGSNTNTVQEVQRIRHPQYRRVKRR